MNILDILVTNLKSGGYALFILVRLVQPQKAFSIDVHPYIPQLSTLIILSLSPELLKYIREKSPRIRTV